MAQQAVIRDPNEMVAVEISTFVPGSMLPADIYLQLAEDKFIKVSYRGEQVPIERFKKYRNQGVTYVYVDRDQYRYLVEKNIVIQTFMTDAKDLNFLQKTHYLRTAAEAVYTEIEQMGFDNDSFEHAKQVVRGALKIVNYNQDLEKLLALLQKNSAKVVNHSMGVAMFASMIAKQMEWTHPSTLEKLSVACLLHDIGKKELPPALVQKSRAEMTYEEMTLYESHTYRGMVILQAVPNISDDIIQMVYQHHEVASGHGYPQHIKDVKTHPMAKVVALANTFAELCLEHPNSHEKKSAESALHYIRKVMGQPYNKQVFQALELLVLGDPSAKKAG